MSQRQTLVATQANNPRQKRITEFTQLLRFFNIVLSLCIIGFGVYCYVGLHISKKTSVLEDPSLIVLPAYVTLAGLIILCVQFNIRFVVRNMKFLFHYLGRGIFNVYVGILCFALIRPQLSTAYRVIVYVAGGLMTILGALYIIATICCCARASEDYEEDNEQREKKEKRLSASIKNQV